MIHGMTVPGAIEAAQRRRGFNRGLFEWLRKAPWGNPAFAGMFLSLVMFGFLGGITGVILGTEQLNLLMHNTLYVPGHFHGTVVTGTTLAFMAVSYLLVPMMFRREIIFLRLARWQPYLFGIGAAGISLAMMGAGTLGVPRRHWDITFSDAVIGFDFPASAYLMMALNGLSAILAATGGVIFIVVIVASILFGKRVESAPVRAVGPPIGTAVGQYGSAGTLKLPGTAVLVGVFFLSFVLYYYVNWKYLAQLWPLH
jgi:cytochrome c oxidase subunit 1